MFTHFFLLLFVKIVLVNANNTCDTIPMTEWSGSPSKRTTHLPLPVGLVVIQHTVTKECLTDDACEDVVRRIRSYHINNLKWTDIGLSFLIGENGKVYEGSAWNIGAHSFGYNNVSIGISFIGDFRLQSPTATALQAAESFLQCAVRQDYLAADYKLIAHSQISNTESPGAHLSGLIRSWPHWVKDFKL